MFAAIRRASSLVMRLAGSSARLLLVIHICGRMAVLVLHNEARIVVVFDGPGRRKPAGGSDHATEGPLSSLPPLLRACFMLAPNEEHLMLRHGARVIHKHVPDQ